MAGIHGKNAQLLVSGAPSVLASGTLVNLAAAGADVYQLQDTTKLNWLFDPDSTDFKIEWQVGASWYYVDRNSAQINYAAGAIQLPGVTNATYVAVKNVKYASLVDVTHKVSQNKSWDLNFEQDVIDATTMGEYWGTSLPGIPKFSGSITGLWLDNAKYQKAVVNASGLQLYRIGRFRPNQGAATYYQGVLRFSNWGISASFDGPIEETLDFQGSGPLDSIVNGVPFFNQLF